MSDFHKKVKWVEKFMDEGQKGDANYDSLQEPFCRKSISDDQGMGFNNQKVNAVLEKIVLPPTLRIIYQIIGEDDTEFYFNNWTLMSLNSIIARQKVYVENDQERVIDFAFGYMGMGHIVVVAFDPIDFKIFFRRDGGSNGWDREANWAHIKTYEPQETDKHDFSVWTKSIEENKDMFEIAADLCIKP